VTVNGVACDFCSTSTCSSGYHGHAIQCENVAPGYTLDSCHQRNANPGFLEVFFMHDPSIGTGCLPIIVNPEVVEE
jgi:hypothetical protein